MLKQLIPQDFCLNCPGCCRFAKKDSPWQVYLTDREVQNFGRGQAAAGLISAERKINLIFSAEDETFICPLLQPQNNHCRLYQSRPFDCQLYPFLLNRRGKNVFLAASPHCLYIRERLSSPEVKKYVKYLGQFFQGAAGRRFLKNNPHIIHYYPKVKNLLTLIV